MTEEASVSNGRTPTRRRVVGGFAVLAIVFVVGLVAMADWLRHDHPAAGPLTPETGEGPDPLREEVECDLEQGREGADREEAMSEPALPVEVTSNELYDCPQTWDGRSVRYTGEVVGALLQRGEHTWTQLNDDVYADAGAPLPTHRDFRGGNAGVGVRMPTGMAEQVEWIGGPGRHGDVLEVVGTFHRVHEDSGEVAVIVVEDSRMVAAGRELDLPDSPARKWVASLAALVALGVVVVERRVRDRR